MKDGEARRRTWGSGEGLGFPRSEAGGQLELCDPRVYCTSTPRTCYYRKD